jgi:hypothetical protein
LRNAYDLLGQANCSIPLFGVGDSARQDGDAILASDANAIVAQLAAVFEITANLTSNRLVAGDLGRRTASWQQHSSQ